MSITEALQDWRELAVTATELGGLRQRLARLEAEHAQARAAFDRELEQLEETDREAIVAIMSAYELKTEAAPDRPDNESAEVLRWLLNKVGNEGVGGIRWGNVLDAWHSQFPGRSATTLYGVLNAHHELFDRSGQGKEALVTLTAKGHASFLK